MSKSSRLSEFFQSDGRTVIVPIDHGTAIPVPGLADTGALIESLLPHADGFVVNLGVAQAFRDTIGDKGLCLRTDCYKPAHGDNTDEGPYRLYGADEAAEVEAGAMMNMLYVHHRNEAENFRECAELLLGIRFFNPSVLSPPVEPGWRGVCRTPLS